MFNSSSPQMRWLLGGLFVLVVLQPTAAHASASDGKTSVKKIPSEVSCAELLEQSPSPIDAPWLSDRAAGKVFWTIPSNRRAFVAWRAKEKGLQTAEGLYSLTRPDFADYGGAAVLGYYEKGSVPYAVTELFPEIDFHVWQFPKVPPYYFDSKEHRLQYIKWLEKELGIEKPQDWYSVRIEDVVARKGEWAKRYYSSAGLGHARQGMATESFPDFKFNPTFFVDKNGNRAKGYWNDWYSQQAFLAELEDRCGFWSPGCWYRFQGDGLSSGEVSIIQRQFGGLASTARARYPWFTYKEWIFAGSVPDGFWTKKENRLDYLKWLEEQLGIKGPEGWYQVIGPDFDNNHGGGLLQDKAAYNHDVRLAAQELYPDYDFKDWLFERGVSDGYWKDRTNRIAYLKWAETQQGFESPEDWYGYNVERMRELKGAGLMVSQYDFDREKLLADLYPQYTYLPWLFAVSGTAAKPFLNKWENRRDFMDWASGILGFHGPEDWYGVSRHCISTLPGGVGLLGFYEGSLENLLIDIYPEFNWKKDQFKSATLKTQRWMLHQLRKIYPELEEGDFVWNAKPSQFLFTEAQNYEIDVFIPKMNLGFEYQGEGHYEDVQFPGSNPEEFVEVVRRDQVKRSVAAENSITLIEVPWSWNGSQEDLERIIQLGPHAWETGAKEELNKAIAGFAPLHAPIDYRKIPLVRKPRPKKSGLLWENA